MPTLSITLGFPYPFVLLVDLVVPRMELLNSLFPFDGLMEVEDLDHGLASIEVEHEVLAILL